MGCGKSHRTPAPLIRVAMHILRFYLAKIGDAGAEPTLIGIWMPPTRVLVVFCGNLDPAPPLAYPIEDTGQQKMI